VTAETLHYERPEIGVLLGCVGRDLSASHKAEIRGLLNGPLDWQFLFREAHRHAVLPLLHRGLSRDFQAEAPAPVLATLRESCRRVQQRNLALTAELLRILASLENAGIPAVPFKGPMLAALAYRELAMRTFADLDILLHEQDLTHARELLESQGYVSEYRLTPSQERAFRKVECALQMRHPARNVVLELHWLLTERYLSIHLPVQRFWENLVPARLAGRTVSVFAPEDLLLYLCVHGSKHRWDRLEWLCSIAELIAAYPALDWRHVAESARTLGIERMLHLGLLLAHRLVALPVPDALRDDIDRDLTAQTLAHDLAANLFDPARQREQNRGNWYLYLLRSRERWTDRVRIVLFSWVRQPHPSSEELIALPPRLSFLYYLLRPLRLLTASTSAAWRHVARHPRTDATKAPESICTR
jgi:hypothetical protein